MKMLKFNKLPESFHNLRMQLVLFYVAVSFVILAICSATTYAFILDILKRNNEKYLLQQFKQADNNISSLFNEVDRLSRLFLLDGSIQQFLEDNYNTEELQSIEMKNAVINSISDFIINYNYINSIYIYPEDLGGIGGSTKTTRIVRSYEDGRGFFESNLYKNAKGSFPYLVMEGGFNARLFNPYIKESATYLISAARGVKPTLRPERSAILVFNIEERYIASLYSGSGSAPDEHMYIMDKQGKIISGNDAGNIGSDYSLLSRVDINSTYGSFSADTEVGAVQIVYYKLKCADWYLVDEKPVAFFTEDIVILQRVIVGIFILCIMLIFFISIVWTKRITDPLRMIAARMQEMSKGRLGITLSHVPKNEFGILTKRFNEMSLSIVDLLKKNNEIQEEKRLLEIEALQYQINPHFLYNALNMLKWMAAMIHADHIVNGIVALGNILKPVFKSKDTMCVLGEEMEYLENYIKILNLRFSNRVAFSFDIDDRFLSIKIPRFILQPIIENSITHGMQNKVNQIHINIAIEKAGDDILIKVSDNGQGIAPEKLGEIRRKLRSTGNISSDSFPGNGAPSAVPRKRLSEVIFSPVLKDECFSLEEQLGENIGLSNVNRRVRLNFGKDYGVRLENNPMDGVTVTICVPLRTNGQIL